MHSVGSNRRFEGRWRPEDLMQMGIGEFDAYSLASRISRCSAKPPVDPSSLIDLVAKRRISQSTREHVLTCLDAMFSHAETLQCSFQLDSDRRGVNSQELDLTLVRSFYNCLMSLHDREVVDVIMRRVRRLLHRTDFENGPVLVTRALLIVLFCPCFMDVEYHGNLVDALRVIRSLSGASRSDLTRHLVQLTKEQMTALLDVLQQFLTITIFRPSRNQFSDAEDVIEVMGLLFEANQSSHVITHEAFYNSAVNGPEFDIEDDFRSMMEERSSDAFYFCNYPFVFDSGSKSRIMQLENGMAQDEAFEGAFWRSVQISDSTGEEFCPFLLLRVRRGQLLLQDAIDHIHMAKERHLLKCPLKVQFEGEDGVDEGGLAKEFFQLVLRQLFDVDYGMFTYDDETRLWWFRSSNVINLVREFELVGTLLGLAIFNNHILDLHFPRVVYKKLLGHDLDLEDLKEVFPDVHRSLKWLVEMENGISGLGLHFVVDHDTGLGERVSVDLIPDGRRIKVTRHNRFKFVELYTKFLLETSIESQFNAFRAGFLNISLSRSLHMFLPEELEQAICGRKMIDLHSLEAHAQYAEGFRRSHRVIRWFWEFAHGLTEEGKKKLLSFVTGSDRVPIRGFADLIPPFTITRGGPHTQRLPTAHTCFNLLHLPEYPTHEVLHRKMQSAIENAEGFGLM